MIGAVNAGAVQIAGQRIERRVPQGVEAQALGGRLMGAVKEQPAIIHGDPAHAAPGDEVLHDLFGDRQEPRHQRNSLRRPG